MPDATAYDVFLSHSSADKPWVRQLAAAWRPRVGGSNVGMVDSLKSLLPPARGWRGAKTDPATWRVAYNRRTTDSGSAEA
jgi:hypothetical protein